MLMKRGKIHTTFFILVIFLCAAFYGCSNDTNIQPAGTAKKQAVKKPLSSPAAIQPQVALTEDTPEQEGYVYEQRGRRDPFSSLIIPVQKSEKDASKMGTLEGYDISEFILLAIAKKGTEFYGLLATPDNRSFTVNKGNTIGLSNGKVVSITDVKIELVEYTKDYKGD